MAPEIFFEKIEDHLQANLPFVVYRHPREDEVYALFQKKSGFAQGSRFY